jgi:hypothetical protein
MCAVWSAGPLAMMLILDYLMPVSTRLARLTLAMDMMVGGKGGSIQQYYWLVQPGMLLLISFVSWRVGRGGARCLSNRRTRLLCTCLADI